MNSRVFLYFVSVLLISLISSVESASCPYSNCQSCNSNSTCGWCAEDNSCQTIIGNQCSLSKFFTSKFDCGCSSLSCSVCLATTNCGYCTSSGRCLNGTVSGPLNSYCETWNLGPSFCNINSNSVCVPEVSNMSTGVGQSVRAMILYQGFLYIGGSFSDATIKYVSKWNGSNWTALSSGTDDVVNAFAVFQNFLIVVGDFGTAGSLSAARIAKWDGSVWSLVGSGTEFAAKGEISSVQVFQNSLFVGGIFLFKWTGSSWIDVETVSGGAILEMQVINNEMYVGGSYKQIGGRILNSIAKFDGTTWFVLGNSTHNGTNGPVFTISSIGSDVYLGGDFVSASGLTGVGRFIKWTGSKWVLMNTTFNFGVRTSAVVGSEIWVGGLFNTGYIQKWNGTNWEQPFTTTTSVLSMLFSYPYLYFGGDFTGGGIRKVAKYGAACRTNSPTSAPTPSIQPSPPTPIPTPAPTPISTIGVPTTEPTAPTPTSTIPTGVPTTEPTTEIPFTSDDDDDNDEDDNNGDNNVDNIEEGSNLTLIIGVVAGIVGLCILIGILVVIILVVVRKRKSNNGNNETELKTQPQPQQHYANVPEQMLTLPPPQPQKMKPQETHYANTPDENLLQRANSQHYANVPAQMLTLPPLQQNQFGSRKNSEHYANVPDHQMMARNQYANAPDQQNQTMYANVDAIGLK